MKLSVIVPLYRGQGYILNLIQSLEACTKKLNGSTTVELVLSNDFPGEKIFGRYYSDIIDVVALDTDINRGIHGARMNGYLYSTGDYVVFLDQDDWISPNYLASQTNVLRVNNADAVVCRAKENGREIYNAAYPFEKTIDYRNMISVGNAIVSPGQVLIRRETIPAVWQSNILKNNGVDDWFLWICMMQQGCHFVLNEDILFEHRVRGSNSSWNSREMLASEMEMLEIAKSKELLDAERLTKLEKVIEAERQRYICFLEKFRAMFFIYDKWMNLESHKECLAEYLYQQEVREVAVYGMGYIGKQLVDRLKDKSVAVCGAIDRNAGFIDAGVPIARLEEFDEKPDLIIVTVVENAEEIVRNIEKQINVPAITIRQLLESWEQGEWIRRECNEHCIDDR